MGDAPRARLPANSPHSSTASSSAAVCSCGCPSSRETSRAKRSRARSILPSSARTVSAALASSSSRGKPPRASSRRPLDCRRGSNASVKRCAIAPTADPLVSRSGSSHAPRVEFGPIQHHRHGRPGVENHGPGSEWTPRRVVLRRRHPHEERRNSTESAPILGKPATSLAHENHSHLHSAKLVSGSLSITDCSSAHRSNAYPTKLHCGSSRRSGPGSHRGADTASADAVTGGLGEASRGGGATRHRGRRPPRGFRPPPDRHRAYHHPRGDGDSAADLHRRCSAARARHQRQDRGRDRHRLEHRDSRSRFERSEVAAAGRRGARGAGPVDRERPLLQSRAFSESSASRC
jgi:hypothetical protein